MTRTADAERRRRDLPVFPLSPDPVRAYVGRDARAVRLELDPIGPHGGPRIALVTLGCDKNTVDSERIMATLVGHGARMSSDPAGADVVIINTCGFIQAAKEESIETILDACRLKEEGEVRAVVAVGCMVERYQRELACEIPEVDLYLGLTGLSRLIPELRERGLLSEPSVPLMEQPLRVLAAETAHTSYLKISEGCDHTYAFCAIPLMRGLYRSAPLEELVHEAAALARQGVRELNVVSQDTTWYGRDLRRRDPAAPLLPDLLEALLQRTGIDWYRMFYMYPSGITPAMVELLARASGPGAGSRILLYLDMPLQHGSDRVLAAMRRPERRRTIRERVGWLRNAIPDLTLRTTVIVGFPGETDDDFRALLDLLEELRFGRVGAFAYSPRTTRRRRSWPTRSRSRCGASGSRSCSTCSAPSGWSRTSNRSGRCGPCWWTAWRTTIPTMRWWRTPRDRRSTWTASPGSSPTARAGCAPVTSRGWRSSRPASMT